MVISNLTNGHYYEPVNTAVTWTEALNLAGAKSYLGLKGYLLTVTSTEGNQWATNFVSTSITTGWDSGSVCLAASDYVSEGTWKWMGGPENGSTFWLGASTGSTVNGHFNAWIVSYIQNENSAGGMSGSWLNPSDSGASHSSMPTTLTQFPIGTILTPTSGGSKTDYFGHLPKLYVEMKFGY